ncbi:urease accessory protein UreE [Bicyclus anynana]|uniref:Urease accessory protein UreE n=1 Tax=Bicyclus anynana TaxID=110368 RepID=A0ABM3M0R7_BICAN|nr:urease accessory protein UreE [Bicyclus anynana]
MFANFPFKFTSLIILSVIVEIIPIQMQMPNGEEYKRNSVDGSQLNDCLSVTERSEMGVCFGKELLNRLNDYDETDSFSLATGVSFVRDEKLPRDIGSFLDKDPMDFRSIIEDASGLISKRSLRWDLGRFYPGLVMRIGPTLANGVLEFVIDPRAKDRSFQHGKLTTGRLLTRNLLLPFLLGIKFQMATLLPLLLGLLLLASKKAFLLAKLALFAVTIFASRGTNYGETNFFENLLGPSSHSSHEHSGHHHHHSSGGYYGDHRHYPHHSDHGHSHHEHDHSHDHGHSDHGEWSEHSDRGDYHYYKEKSDKTEPTLAPITPDELRDRLERLFVTKKDKNDPREEPKMINARNYPWTPISGG